MLSETYKKLIGWKCLNPECRNTISHIEVHHILPVSEGGPDQAWNYITLCRECHMLFHRLVNSDCRVDLFTYKALAEIKAFGFTFDEENKYDLEKLNKLLHERALPKVGPLPAYTSFVCEENEAGIQNGTIEDREQKGIVAPFRNSKASKQFTRWEIKKARSEKRRKPRIDIVCSSCSKSIKGKTNQKYCSAICRFKAWSLKHPRLRPQLHKGDA
jgi:hypothetical protein